MTGSTENHKFNVDGHSSLHFLEQVYNIAQDIRDTRLFFIH